MPKMHQIMAREPENIKQALDVTSIILPNDMLTAF